MQCIAFLLECNIYQTSLVILEGRSMGNALTSVNSSLLEQLARLFLPGASTNGKRLHLHRSALLD